MQTTNESENANNSIFKQTPQDCSIKIEDVRVIRDKLTEIDKAWATKLSKKMKVSLRRIRSIVGGSTYSGMARVNFILKGKELYDEIMEDKNKALDAISTLKNDEIIP